ncbi:MAG: FRG domain-containing protein [Chloroflexi bacterium]|nr:FRG domain-containing protein [Chloroflexota bacterium]
MAQHHGIPTRLIDWTYNPLTAAFFAAEDTVRLQAKGQPISKNMVIYALHEKMATTKHLTLVHHPNSMDTYIRAQEGVFTLDGDAETAYLGTGSWPDYEQSLNRLTSLFGSGLMPRKIIVPVSEARELLRLLSIEGITRDGLMPTLDNVAASIRFEWMLKYTGN